jgi:hypothetical protein
MGPTWGVRSCSHGTLKTSIPERPPSSRDAFANTLALKTPHKVLSAVGVSFFARAIAQIRDYPSDRPDPAVLIVGAGGAQFLVDDTSILDDLRSDRVTAVDRDYIVGP